MNQPALHTVYQAVIMAKLLYAAPACWGFTTTIDRNRITGFVRRSVRSGFCEAGLVEISTLVDELLKTNCFTRSSMTLIMVLFQLLPDQRGELTYSLRKRSHDRLLTQRTSHLSGCNFITRKLFQDSY